MFYKIENKKCEVYKKLHELRTKELQMEKDNISAIKEKTGLKWKGTFGHHGQQNFRRVASYTGFEFKVPDKVDEKVWKRHKENKEIFIPNTRTKLGREMEEFLRNGLQGSNYDFVFKFLNINNESRRFTLPFIEIANNEILIIYLGDDHEPKDENVIEITKKEFQDLRKDIKISNQ